MKSIGIIGCGNMGEAILKGLYVAGTRPSAIIVGEVDTAKRSRLARRYGVTVTGDNRVAASASRLLILAVKPQEVEAVIGEIASSVDAASTTILSIAAGVSTGRIEKLFGKPVACVRAMPNMPALVGKGITALARGRYARMCHVKAAEGVLQTVGRILRVKESKMDAVTAVSGSGPAYFFYLVEALVEAGTDLGLSEAEASTLAIETAAGSGAVVASIGESAKALRRRVTSKGGTTEAAIRVFESKKFREIVRCAVAAAHARAGALNRGESIMGR